MHIVFATMQYGANYYQGTERYIHNLSNGLIAAGHQVSILSGDPEQQHSTSGIGEHIADSDPSIIKIPSPCWATVLGSDKDVFRQILEKLKADIFHMVNPGHIGINAIFAAKELGLKTLITVTDFWWLCPKHTLTTQTGELCEGNKPAKECRNCIAKTHVNPTYRALAKLPITGPMVSGSLARKLKHQHLEEHWENRPAYIQKAFNQADHVVVLSRTAQRYLDAKYQLNASTQISVGLSKLWFEDIREWQAKDFTQQTAHIAYAGTIAQHKGLHILLEAIAKLPQHKIKLTIAGSGSDKTYMKRVKRLALPLNVEWKGQLEQREMRDFIDQADLIVLPSLWSENQPQVILESIARNTCVICSDAPGAAELINPQYVYNANNADALSDALSSWLRNPSYKPAAAASNIDQMVSKTDRLYHNLVRGSFCF